MAAIFAPLPRSSSKIAVASAAPSTGSVPAPSSSKSTRLFSSASEIIFIIFFICAEKVESDCSMLCSSPMSASTLPKTDTSLFSSAGIKRPHMAIRVKRPIVFSVTVLPPVLGPVITSVSKLVPSSMSVGTTLSLSMRGCLALCSSILPSLFNLGLVAFIEYASEALAKTTLSFTAVLYPCSVPPANFATSPESSKSILSISFFSSDLSIFTALFASTAPIGSMKTVEPLDDVSCTRPFTSPLYSAFTGTTNRPLRMVTMGSCRYFW